MNKKLILKLASMILLAVLAVGLASSANATEVTVTSAPQAGILNIRPGTIPTGISFYGDSLSGKSLSEAKALVRIPADNIDYTDYTARSSIHGDYVYGRKANEMGVTYDLDSVNAVLDASVLHGNVLERYKQAKDSQLSPIDLNLNIQCDETYIYNMFNDVLAQWRSNPVNAKVSSLTGQLVVTPGSNGYDFDISAGIHEMCEDIKNARIDDSGWYYFNMGEYEIEPNLTTERASTFSIIGSYTTSFFAPTTETLANRMQNLITSTSHMCGWTFAPGETASALTMYGPVTAENGFALAGTFNESSHTLEMGGGICQTTTTLYNAVLLAELQVTLRRNHSMLVIYVDPSMDAMVYAQGNSDFQFVNNSSDYITIDAYVNPTNYTLTVNIIGHEDHAPDHKVRYESHITSIAAPTVTVVDDPSRGIGWKNPERKFGLAGSDGPTCEIRSELWKVTTDNGVETRTLDHTGDYYKPGTATYYVAPDTQITLGTSGPRDAGYVTITASFLNGTSLAANPATMTDDELIGFNSSMAGLMEGKGYTWPYSNNGWTDEDPDGDWEPPTEPEEDDEDSDNDSGDDSGDDSDSGNEDND